MPGGAKAGSVVDDDQVVERPAGVLDDPVPLLLVDHVAPSVGEHARRA